MSSAARAESLWEVELRTGYGVAIGGGDGMPTTRSSPLTFSGSAAIAFNSDPILYGYGGMLVETLNRSSVGAVGGVRMLVGRMRIAGGGVRVFEPYTLWGAELNLGTCKRVASSMQACGSADLIAYFAGDDLAPGHTVTQVQLALGMVFDAP